MNPENSCQEKIPTKSPEEEAIPYVLIAIIGGVVLFLLTFVCCAIYYKKKKRDDKVKPLLVSTNNMHKGQ